MDPTDIQCISASIISHHQSSVIAIKLLHEFLRLVQAAAATYFQVCVHKCARVDKNLIVPAADYDLGGTSVNSATRIIVPIPYPTIYIRTHKRAATEYCTIKKLLLAANFNFTIFLVTDDFTIFDHVSAKVTHIFFRVSCVCFLP